MPLLLATTPQPGFSPWVVMILTVLVLGIAVIFLVYTRHRIARRNFERGTPRERLDAIKERARATDDIDRRSSELVDLTRRLAAQLDNKAERVEQLITQADERIAALGGLAPAASTGHNKNGTQPPAAERLDGLSAPDENRDSLSDEIHRLADDGFSPVEIAQRLDEQTGKVELVLALRDGS